MHRLVLTGGPCGGKTTAQSYLKEKLADFGFSAIFVPEAATMVIGSGLNPGSLTKEQIEDFEGLMLDAQLRLETLFATALEIKSGDPKKQILIMDRGCMDIRAYTEEEMFKRILWRRRLSVTDIRDKRYDAVFHLVTAAEGKEAYYTLENNPSRLEKEPAQAREADCKTREAWIGHPHLVVIDNSTLFDAKLKRLWNAIRKHLGVPVAIEIERKFLVANPQFAGRLPVPHQKVEIEQIYIIDGTTGESRIRRRSQDNEGSVYYETFKQPTGSAMTRIETENQIDSVAYNRKVKMANPDCDVLRKNRYCFLYNNQYFELDVFTEPERLRGLMLLEIELTEENDKVDIPSWIGSATEVTDDPKWTNFSLAKRL